MLRDRLGEGPGWELLVGLLEDRIIWIAVTWNNVKINSSHVTTDWDLSGFLSSKESSFVLLLLDVRVREVGSTEKVLRAFEGWTEWWKEGIEGRRLRRKAPMGHRFQRFKLLTKSQVTGAVEEAEFEACFSLLTPLLLILLIRRFFLPDSSLKMNLLHHLQFQFHLFRRHLNCPLN